MKQINVIVETIGGLPECPKLIADDKKAFEIYCELAKENGFDEEEFNWDDPDLTEEEVVDAASDYFSSSDYDLRWFQTEIE